MASLSQLISKPLINSYIEWSINERKVKGYSLLVPLSLLFAAMRQHPQYKSADLMWFRALLNSLPLEHASELRRRKAGKYADYELVESIPVKLHSERSVVVKKGITEMSRLCMKELLMRWLVTLPWRQRNIRECRIAGVRPNLFQGKIPPYSEIDKPEWVKLEEQNNPDAQFWQFQFSGDETKTGIEVQALLPRQLIGPLQEYLEEFRKHLIRGTDPGTLFVNQAGQPMQSCQMGNLVSTLTIRYAGKRITPHPFRDIVAFAWLKAHPKDYLTLSKILWHSNINTTIKIYGGRFNESSGVCAMESWLDEREAKPK